MKNAFIQNPQILCVNLYLGFNSKLVGLNDQAHSKLKYLIFEMCHMDGGMTQKCVSHMWDAFVWLERCFRVVLHAFSFFCTKMHMVQAPLHVSCNLYVMFSKCVLRPKFLGLLHEY